VALTAGWTGQPAAEARVSAPVKRVVAIGDIHGDLDAFAAILRRASLVDADLKWSGGATTLVQVGDMIDRGPKSRAVMDLLMTLQKDARRQDGRVIVLLGNHEAMNMYGDLRYVTPADYVSYADAGSARRQAAAYDDYTKVYGAPASRDEWMAAHPLGFVEQREAFGPDGKYGKWLRTLPVVARVDDSLFLHGGLSADLATWKIDRINDTVAGELKVFDDTRQFLMDAKVALPFSTMGEVLAAAKAVATRRPDAVKDLLGFDNWLSVGDTGPLWFRGLARDPDADMQPLAAKIAQSFGVARIVIGHTTQTGKIVQRFDGKVCLIDTGMLHGYVEGGRASALEIQDGHVRAIYPDGVETLK
jgi:hypothetical protein